MERVDVALGDRPSGGHEGLGGHLAPEHPLALLLGLGASEDVDLDGLEIEELDELVEGFAHRAM